MKTFKYISVILIFFIIAVFATIGASASYGGYPVSIQLPVPTPAPTPTPKPASSTTVSKPAATPTATPPPRVFNIPPDVYGDYGDFYDYGDYGTSAAQPSSDYYLKYAPTPSNPAPAGMSAGTGAAAASGMSSPTGAAATTGTGTGTGTAAATGAGAGTGTSSPTGAAAATTAGTAPSGAAAFAPSYAAADSASISAPPPFLTAADSFPQISPPYPEADEYYYMGAKGLSGGQITDRLIELIGMYDGAPYEPSAGQPDAQPDGLLNGQEGSQPADQPKEPFDDLFGWLSDGAGEFPDDAVFADGGAEFINVTNPNGDGPEVVYSDMYSICGVRDDNADPEVPITLFLARYDYEADNYAALADSDGEAMWTIGANGVFIRNVLLEEGDNNFAVVACAASTIDAAKTEGREIAETDIQIERFTITYRAQNVAEKISEIFKDLTIANILKEIENR